MCQESTDFHFPDLEQQFERIEQEVVKANEWRQQQKLASEEGGDQISVKSSGSSSSEVCPGYHKLGIVKSCVLVNVDKISTDNLTQLLNEKFIVTIRHCKGILIELSTLKS